MRVNAKRRERVNSWCYKCTMSSTSINDSLLLLLRRFVVSLVVSFRAIDHMLLSQEYS